ncbi:MAG: HD domain-containing protein, partial [Pseudomonadota bacterium]
EACPPGDLDLSDFMPASPRDRGEMLDELKSLAATVTDPDLLELLDAFFSDPVFTEKFTSAPAAKMMHHAYLGGLLEHSLSVALLAEAAARHYPDLDRDLLVTGAVLHDIGKTTEFTWGASIDYSDPGRLLSHIVLGVQMLDEKIAGIPGFPEGRALLLRHMLISHHGSREFGSPEPGKTVEAVVLNLLDDLDAKVMGIRQFMEAQDPDASWSAFHRTLERHFYLGSREEGE